MTDLFLLRGLERIFVVAAAALFGFLGYRLFLHGHTRGRAVTSIDSAWAKFIFSGTGPGLIFMAFGAVVLVWSLASGGVKTTERKSVEVLHEDVADLKHEFQEVQSEMQMLRYELDAPTTEDGGTEPAE